MSVMDGQLGWWYKGTNRVIVPHQDPELGSVFVIRKVNGVDFNSGRAKMAWVRKHNPQATYLDDTGSEIKDDGAAAAMDVGPLFSFGSKNKKKAPLKIERPSKIKQIMRAQKDTHTFIVFESHYFGSAEAFPVVINGEGDLIKFFADPANSSVATEFYMDTDVNTTGYGPPRLYGGYNGKPMYKTRLWNPLVYTPSDGDLPGYFTWGSFIYGVDDSVVKGQWTPANRTIKQI